MQLQEYAVPATWRIVLRSVQDHYPEAVIAGGAIRDLLTGRAPKDIDIFINGALRSAMGVRDVMWDEFITQPKMVINPEFCDYTIALDGVEFAMEIDVPGFPLPVQLIAMTDPVTMISAVERIDFGICRAAYDGSNIFLAKEFTHDLAHEQFTLVTTERSPEALKRSMERYMRLQAKFPGWPLIGMPKFEMEMNDIGSFDVV